MKFPDKLDNFLRDFKREQVKLKEREERVKKEGKKREKKIQAKRLANGLAYAKKIYKWSEDFRKSDKGKELIKISHIPTAYEQVFIFTDEVESVDRWVGLVVDKKGLWLDYGGMYSHSNRVYISSAVDLAKKVETKVLKAVCHSIDNGKIWKCIQSGFDCLKEKDENC